MINTIVKVFRGIAKLRGATDNTLIGNVGDRLKTESARPALVTDSIPSLTSLLSYDDMNALTGGTARGTIINDTIATTVYNYIGTGLLFGLVTTLEKLDGGWIINIVVDGRDIFGPGGMDTRDLDKDNLYAFDTNKRTDDPWMGIDVQKDTFRWKSPFDLPIRFNSSIEVKVKRTIGNKKFRAGLITVYKET